MCVKEFLGYNCGHCSIPVLRQCPLSASNSVFPICKWPAERPIFTNEYCHPCSRVVWNTKVLKEEEEHRARHLAGECMCEFIFEGEDREKRFRQQGIKGAHKSNGKGVLRGGHGLYGISGRAVGEEGSMVEGDHCDIEKRSGAENIGSMTDAIYPRQEWEPEVQKEAYDYAGYYVDIGQNQGSDDIKTGPSYAVSLGGHQQDQLPMGHTGAGMKWYPQDNLIQTSPANAYEKVNEGIQNGPRATPEPIGKYNHPGFIDKCRPVLTQPIVVSSDMVSS